MPIYTPDEFANILMGAAAKTPKETADVVRKGATNVKAGARRNVLQTAPVHNAGAHRFISADVDGPGLLVTAEIGYDRVSGGKLGNLLEYGGGGDHSPPHLDLARALDGEVPWFLDALGDMGEQVIE